MADAPVPTTPKTVVLRDADGTAYETPVNSVSKALASGFRQETDEEAKDRELRKWASDNPTLASAAAAARTLSFGASGFIKPNTQRALKEENPIASGIGEFGGLALPIAGQFGVASKAAKILSESNAVRQAATVLDTVAKATGLPMAGAAKVGGAVSKAVAGAAPGVARKALGTAAGFAAESELYHIGANLGEAALGDEELTADRVLANSRQALAFGAGLGFAGSLAASGVSKLIGKSMGALEKSQRFLRDEFPQVQSLQDAATAAKEAYVDHAAKASGHSREKVEQLVGGFGTPEGMAARERFTTPLSDQEVDKLGKAFTESLEESFNATNKAFRDKGWGEIATAQIDKLIGPRPLEPIMQDSQGMFTRLRELENLALKAPERHDMGILKQFRETVDGFEQAINGVIHDPAAIAKAKLAKVQAGEIRLSEREVFDLMAQLRKQPSVVRDSAKNAAEVFDNVVELRRRLDDMIPYTKRGERLTENQKVMKKLLLDARGETTKHLRNAGVYGEGAVARAQLDALSKKFFDAVGPGSPFAEFYTKKGKGKDISSVKGATFLRQIEAFRGADRTEALDAYFTTMHEVNTGLDELAKQVDTIYDAGKLEGIRGKTMAARDEAARRLADSAKARQATNDTTALLERKTIGVGTGAVVGAVLGGPIGAIAGAGAQYAYQLAKDPILMGRTILALERMNAKVGDQTRESIKGFLGSAIATGKSAAKATASAAKSAAKATSKIGSQLDAPTSVFAMREFLDSFDKKHLPKVEGGDPKDSQRLKDFRQMEALLIDLTSNPERAYERYAQAFKPFQSAAPNLTQRLVEKQLQAAAFLDGKRPKNPSYGKTLNDAINDWRPSDQDLAKFERYVKAAQDPLSVLDDLKRGTITREGVETLQVLYPALYANIQQVTMENLATLQKRLPYAQRINLSLLLNVPVDPSVSPSFVATMQGFYAGTTQDQIQGQKGGQAKAGGSAIHAGAFRNSKAPANLMTGAQRITYKSQF